MPLRTICINLLKVDDLKNKIGNDKGLEEKGQEQNYQERICISGI